MLRNTALGLGAVLLALTPACEKKATVTQPKASPAASAAPRPHAAPAPTMQPSAGGNVPTAASPAPSPQSPSSPKDALRARAEENWAARKNEDWATLFKYEDKRVKPDVTEKEFADWSKANYPFRIHSYKIGETIVDGDMGWVQVNCSSSVRKFAAARPVDVERWEKWKRLNGEWIPVPDQDLGAYPSAPPLRDVAAEASLRARFEESWEARKNADWGHLYSFTDPRDRDTVSIEKFSETHALFGYRDCTIHWVEVMKGGEIGSVWMTVTHKLTDPSLTKAPPRSVTVSEKWNLIDGEWYMELVPNA
jgi:hypothetical protein